MSFGTLLYIVTCHELVKFVLVNRMEWEWGGSIDLFDKYHHLWHFYVLFAVWHKMMNSLWYTKLKFSINFCTVTVQYVHYTENLFWYGRNDKKLALSHVCRCQYCRTIYFNILYHDDIVCDLHLLTLPYLRRLGCNPPLLLPPLSHIVYKGHKIWGITNHMQLTRCQRLHINQAMSSLSSVNIYDTNTWHFNTHFTKLKKIRNWKESKCTDLGHHGTPLSDLFGQGSCIYTCKDVYLEWMNIQVTYRTEPQTLTGMSKEVSDTEIQKGKIQCTSWKGLHVYWKATRITWCSIASSSSF